MKTIEKPKKTKKSKELLQSIAKPMRKPKKTKKNKDLNNYGEHGG